MAARRLNWAEEDRIEALLHRCVHPRQLNQIHAHLILTAHSQNNFLIAKLIRSFTDLHCLQHARHIAHTLHAPNVFVWTALIRAYAQLDNPTSAREALLLYTKMHQSSRPLTFTLSSALKACAQMQGMEGLQLHAHAFKYGFQTDARLQTTLVHLYSKYHLLHEARRVFDGILSHGGAMDVQAWNTIVSSYAVTGDMETAHSVFDRMPERNSFTWVEMITGYAASGQMDLSRQLFDMAPPADKNAVVYTAMITGYAKCGDLQSARSIFDDMKERDVATWNAMISAYTHTDEALDLFRLMLRATGVVPNQTTIATIVSACTRSGSPRLARWIHEYVDSRGIELLNNHTVAALIDLHCKCGDLSRAFELFHNWKQKDLICYSSMVAGFGVHGRGKEAIRVFNELLGTDLKPDAICFISVLTACSHAGMVEEGRRFFEEMRGKFCIPPTVEHYMCVVDLLARAGNIHEAYKLVTEEMASCGVRPHAGVWGALLSSCRTYGNVEVGEVAVRELMELEPDNAGNYVLMANIYARAGRWEGVARVRAEMRRRGMRKPPGWSWVEMEDGRTQRFLTGDICDGELEIVLNVLSWELMTEGYFPSIRELE